MSHNIIIINNRISKKCFRSTEKEKKTDLKAGGLWRQALHHLMTGLAIKGLGRGVPVVLLLLLLPQLSAHALPADEPTTDSGWRITIHPTSHEKKIRVTVEGADSTHELQLRISEDFVAKDFVVGLVNEDKSITPQKYEPTRCHYHGTVVGAEGTLAAISACNGTLEVCICM
jgi:hypothetical protein